MSVTAEPPQQAKMVVEAPTSRAWRLRAACMDHDLNLFFSSKRRDIETAKRICRGCPVRVECLMDALAKGERFGVRGGVSAPKRRKSARNMCGTPESKRAGCKCDACRAV